jgi:hypothetical protein
MGPDDGQTINIRSIWVQKARRTAGTTGVPVEWLQVRRAEPD